MDNFRDPNTYNKHMYSSHILLRNMRKLVTRAVFLISLLTPLSVSTAGDTLTPTQSLSHGETLVSEGGTFALGFFSPSTSKNRYLGVWYNNIPVQTVVWVANRQNPITDTTGSMTITTDGSLVITNQNKTTIIWSSTSTSINNPVAQILDSGNLVVKEGNSSDTESFAWQSFDYPTDRMLPGMKVGLNRITGLNRNLTSWKSDDDPSPGDYCFAMDIHGVPQVTLWAGSVRTWWSGAWNGIEFTGPQRDNFSTLTSNFVDNKEETYYTFIEHNKSAIARRVLSNSGVVELFMWIDSTIMWSLLGYFPKDQCDGSAVCGSYGICKPNSLSICSCLQGFEPKLDQERYNSDGSSGCVRRTALDCRNGTDGFMKLSDALLPDASNGLVGMDVMGMGISLDQCRAVCLSNCSCTAYATADVRGNGNGCIISVSELPGLQLSMDRGQDLYVRLAAVDLDSIQQQSLKSIHLIKSIVIIVISVVLGSLLLASSVGCYIWRKKRRRKDEEPIVITEEDDLDLPLFDFGTISAATNNFSKENKLGEGGFGPDYKGMLEEEDEIAVKRLAKTSVQGLDELKTEVSLIAKLQHRNLVRLLGCCIQGEERILIYEYMPNKSLDAFLFDREKKVLLDWKVRCHIIAGIARGLLYLHQDSRLTIIHRDLKSSNILLDKEMNPKISDFGMARIFGGDETEMQTKRVVGTYGYMSPEYVIDGIFSVKSDVFSFGVMLLEIISGEKNKGVYLSGPHPFLLGHAWSLWEKGKSLELVDASMGHDFSVTEVTRCIKIGLLCVQECPEDRPTMSSVVLMLGSGTTYLPEPKQPGFVARRGPFETNPLNSVNSVTIMMSVGR